MSESRVLFATILAPDLTVLKTVTLAGSNQSLGEADVVWAQDRFVFAWAVNGSAYSVDLAMLAADGTALGGIAPVPSGGAGGAIYTNSYSPPRIRLATSASTVAVGYNSVAANNPWTVTVVGLDGALLAGPVGTPGGAYQRGNGLGGTSGGYVVVWTETNSNAHATYVALDGTVGKTADVSTALTYDVHGATDGAGAAFAMTYADGLKFGYAKGDLSDGFELTPAYTPLAPHYGNDRARISVFGGELALFLYSFNEKQVTGIGAGCP